MTTDQSCSPTHRKGDSLFDTHDYEYIVNSMATNDSIICRLRLMLDVFVSNAYSRVCMYSIYVHICSIFSASDSKLPITDLAAFTGVSPDEYLSDQGAFFDAPGHAP